MGYQKEPMVERVRAMEIKMEGFHDELTRHYAAITAANSSNAKTTETAFESIAKITEASIQSFSNHITHETNRWLKAFHWIAFAIMTGGMITLGNTKVFEIILSTILKAIT